MTRHATKRALAVLTGRVDLRSVPSSITACGLNAIEHGDVGAFTEHRAELMKRDPGYIQPNFSAVDCPTCRVHLDAALEGRLL